MAQGEILVKISTCHKDKVNSIQVNEYLWSPSMRKIQCWVWEGWEHKDEQVGISHSQWSNSSEGEGHGHKGDALNQDLFTDLLKESWHTGVR